MSTHRGIVNGIMSGDSLLIRFMPPCAQPLQIVSLSNVSAPRYGSNNGEKRDEPHGAESFEFLRQLCIGQRVLVHDSGQHAERYRGHSVYGKLPVVFKRITLVDKGNKDVATLTTEEGWTEVRDQKYRDDYIQGLLLCQKRAKEAKKGIWRPNGYIRQLPVQYDPAIILKNKNYKALVEGVLNGTTLTLFLLPRNEYIFFQIAGCVAPSTKKDHQSKFGQESRELMARYLLDRIIKIHIDDCTDNKIFLGTIIGKQINAVTKLLASGLSKFRLFSSQFSFTGDDFLRAENEAKSKKLKIWSDYESTPYDFHKYKVSGRVFSIINSNVINISNDIDNRIYRIHLNFIRVPPFCSEPLGFEAREYLRKMLVSKNVEAIIEGSISDYGEFGVVFYDSMCINTELCRKGLAVVAESPIYGCVSDYKEQFIEAEREAKALKLGLHSDNLPETMEFSKIHQRLYHEHGIIERCLGSCRFIVYIPDKKVSLRIGLNGIFPCEELEEQSKIFCRYNYLQRDIDFQVINFDKKHIGYTEVYAINNQTNEKINITIEILKNGFAKINPNSPPNSEHLAAQEYARINKKGIWSISDDLLKEEETENEEENKETYIQYDHVYQTKVVDIIDPITYRVQFTDIEVIKLMEKQNQHLRNPQIDQIAILKMNDSAHLVNIEEVNENNVKVKLIDFNNEIEVSLQNLYVLPNELRDYESPPIQTVRLSCLKNPNNNIREVREICTNVILYMYLMSTDKYPNVLMTDSPSIDSGSLQSVIISKKIATFDESQTYPPIFNNVVKNIKSFQLFF